ncbi:MAG: hypothetical protein HY518_04225 [Candidatus Aenigmarchaeota archaeon]|nr:hypothetical protein [Candidatus Aenigmarchaeota archaeon]
MSGKIDGIAAEAEKIKDPVEAINYMSRRMQEESRGPLDAKMSRQRRVASREAALNRLTRMFTRYETSPTFHDPTVVSAEIDNGATTSFVVLKAKGIERPYVKHLMSDSTYRLYHHESGIVGLVERNNGSLRMTTRIPARIARDITGEISVTYPGIMEGLGFGPQPLGSVEAGFDGDLSYSESWFPKQSNVTKDVSKNSLEAAAHLPFPAALEFLTAIDTNLAEMYLLFVEGHKLLVKRVYELGHASHDVGSRRDERFIHDFEECDDLRRKSEETKPSAYNMIGEPSKIEVITTYRNNKVLGRFYRADMLGAPDFVTELLIPVGVLAKLKKEATKSDIGLVDKLAEGDAIPLEGLKEENGRLKMEAELSGDFVYSRPASSRREYDTLRREIDSLGAKYLECRKPLYGMM